MWHRFHSVPSIVDLDKATEAFGKNNGHMMPS